MTQTISFSPVYIFFLFINILGELVFFSQVEYFVTRPLIAAVAPRVGTFIDQTLSPTAHHLRAAPLPHQRNAVSIAGWKKNLGHKVTSSVPYAAVSASLFRKQDTNVTP